MSDSLINFNLQTNFSAILLEDSLEMLYSKSEQVKSLFKRKHIGVFINFDI